MANDYCTVSQFFGRFDQRTFSELSNDNNSSSGDSDNIQTALDDAASELEAQLRNRYSLPLTTIPNVLTRYVAAKAAQNLYRRRSKLPDGVKEEVKWADDWIEALVMRRTSLPDATPQQAKLVSSESREGRSRFDPGAAHFDRQQQQPTSTNRGKGSF